MNLKFLLLALVSFAYSKQVAFVDLSAPAKTTDTGSRTGWVRGGGVLYHGNAPHPLPGTPTVSLRLTRIITKKDGALVRDIAEVVVTNTGPAPISIPIGADPVPLLASTEKDRRFFVFDVTLGRGAHYIGSAVAASNTERPESSATLQPGDTVMFWLPAGGWLPNSEPPDRDSSNRDVSVSVQLNRKTLENGKDWTEAVGDPVHSRNVLPLPEPAQ